MLLGERYPRAGLRAGELCVALGSGDVDVRPAARGLAPAEPDDHAADGVAHQVRLIDLDGVVYQRSTAAQKPGSTRRSSPT